MASQNAAAIQSPRRGAEQAGAQHRQDHAQVARMAHPSVEAARRHLASARQLRVAYQATAAQFHLDGRQQERVGGDQQQSRHDGPRRRRARAREMDALRNNCARK